ncbi:MAG: glycosyltransferase, partial [Candidatus Tectimicrobiota bacterium]
MRVLIAGGGTGGHLYPGIAIANEFLRREPASEVLFVGTRTGLEATVVPREGFAFETIAVSGVVGKRWPARLAGAARLPVGITQAWSIVGRFRPDLAVGVGGYVAGPAIWVAAKRGVPVLLQEQNLFPGTTNRWLARLARVICVAFAESRQFFPTEKVVVTGNPLRREMLNDLAGERHVRQEPPWTLLVFGGSQGSARLNQAMGEALGGLTDYQGRLRIVHQAGFRHHEAVKQTYEAWPGQAVVEPFLYDMAARYREADMVVCRAGAMTVAEVLAALLPAIFVPFPHAVHHHQE